MIAQEDGNTQEWISRRGQQTGHTPPREKAASTNAATPTTDRPASPRKSSWIDNPPTCLTCCKTCDEAFAANSFEFVLACKTCPGQTQDPRNVVLRYGGSGMLLDH